MVSNFIPFLIFLDGETFNNFLSIISSFMTFFFIFFKKNSFIQKNEKKIMKNRFALRSLTGSLII